MLRRTGSIKKKLSGPYAGSFFTKVPDEVRADMERLSVAIFFSETRTFYI